MSASLIPVASRQPLLDRVVGVSIARAQARGAVILAFHQIRVARFESWVRLLQRHFELVPLDDLVRRRMNGESLAGLLALTFDDGWADTCEPVADLCEREAWPILIYLVSRSCERGTSLWFAELPQLVRDADGKRVTADGWVLDLTNARRARISTASIVKRLKVLGGDEALARVRSLRLAAGLPAVKQGSAFVDAEFVGRYRASRWVKFGSHSVDHQAAAAQLDVQLHLQSAQSRRTLEGMVGEKVRHFAYPYGAPHEIGASAPDVVRAHYDSAVTMVRGVCDGTTDLAQLPRIPLYDSDGDLRMIAKIALSPWL